MKVDSDIFMKRGTASQVPVSTEYKKLKKNKIIAVHVMLVLGLNGV